MRYGWIVGLVMLAGPGMAQNGATLSDCEFAQQDNGFYEVVVCELTNQSDRSIASVRYAWRAVEVGRTVPWGEGPSSGTPDVIDIPGGIEPSETVPVAFSVGVLPPRADLARIEWEITIRQAFDVTGAPIGSEAAMEPRELRDLRQTLRDCWNVDVGSEAAQVTVTLAFNLNPDGRVAGDVRLVRHDGTTPEAAEAAYQSARRAVLRCQGAGFLLPAEDYEQWRHVELTFNPLRAAIE